MGSNQTKKNRFTAVDVQRSVFGPVSVKAIYELYKLHSQCTEEEFKRTKLRRMVDFLRELEDPDYKPKE